MKNATDTRSYIIKAMKDNSSGPYFNTCLDDCLDTYSETKSDLEKAVDDYKSHKY